MKAVRGRTLHSFKGQTRYWWRPSAGWTDRSTIWLLWGKSSRHTTSTHKNGLSKKHWKHYTWMAEQRQKPASMAKPWVPFQLNAVCKGWQLHQKTSPKCWFACFLWFCSIQTCITGFIRFLKLLLQTNSISGCCWEYSLSVHSTGVFSLIHPKSELTTG